MTIDVYSVSKALVSPVQFLQPVDGCQLRNRRLADAFLCKGLLHLWTCNEIDDILCPQEPFLGFLNHPQLDLARDVLIAKDCPARLAQAMDRECLPLHEGQCPLADASCMSIPMSLSL